MSFTDRFFEHEKFMVLDGAFATELEKQGLNLQDPLWSALALIDRDDLIEKIHLSYLKAGADIITTASYQASLRGFMQKCLPREQASALLGKSVTLARKARDRFIKSADFNASTREKPLVAASLGPYGAYLADGSEYRGRYIQTLQEITTFHQERLEIIAREAPDLYALETVPQLSEAVAVAELLNRLDPATPLWIAFSCKNDTCIADGTPIAECAAVLNRYANIFALGVNCTPPQYIERLIRALKARTDKKIIVYPNSGESYSAVSKSWSGSADEFCSLVPVWLRAGANLIGGCCRTGPRQIAKIAALARSPGENQP